MSADGKYVACVDLHDDHNVYIFDAETGNLKGKDKGDTSKIFDVCFSEKPGDNTFATVGSKHIKFWSPDPLKGDKGLFGGKGEQTSFACVAWDNQGTCYSGAVNSMIYVWKGRDLQSTISAHKGGFICALRYANGKLYSGGKDGNLLMINPQTLQVERTITNFNNILIRAIDVVGNKALVGLRDGTI